MEKETITSGFHSRIDSTMRMVAGISAAVGLYLSLGGGNPKPDPVQIVEKPVLVSPVVHSPSLDKDGCNVGIEQLVTNMSGISYCRTRESSTKYID